MQTVFNLFASLTLFSIVSVRAEQRHGPVLAPVNHGGGGGPGLDVSPSKNLVTKISSGVIPKPANLSELDRIDSSTHIYTVDEASKLGFSFGNVDQKYQRKFYVKNFVQYKEISDGNATVWYGVGLRWIVNVRVIDANASLSGVPFVAAAASYKGVEASSQFQVIGLVNPKITQVSQTVGGELNLDSYGNMFSAFKAISELISASETKVQPELVARMIQDDDTEGSYSAALLETWALQQLANGKSLNDANNSFPGVTSQDRLTIAKVYGYFLRTDDPAAKPTKVSIARAEELLRGIKVTKR